MFDYIPFPIFTHTTRMTNFQERFHCLGSARNDDGDDDDECAFL